MALEELDDVYLLRLCLQTGPVLSRGLVDSTGKKVMNRLNKIVRGGMLFKLQTEWVNDSMSQGLFGNLSRDEKQM